MQNKRKELLAEIAILRVKWERLCAEYKRGTWVGADEDVRRAKEYLDDARFELQNLPG